MHNTSYCTLRWMDYSSRNQEHRLGFLFLLIGVELCVVLFCCSPTCSVVYVLYMLRCFFAHHSCIKGLFKLLAISILVAQTNLAIFL